MSVHRGAVLDAHPPNLYFESSFGENVFTVDIVSATADDSAPQPAHQCPPLFEELSHSFSPDPAQRLHARAQFIPQRAHCESEGPWSVRDQGESAGRAGQQVTAYTGTCRTSCCSRDMEDESRFSRQLLSQQAWVLTKTVGCFWLPNIPQTIPQSSKRSLLRATVFTCMGPESGFQNTSNKDQTNGVWL